MADSPPDRPAPAEALALAIRERLSIEGAVELPGIGTLRRHHEPARVAHDDQGHRVLLPPRYTVRFESPA
ncbi:MAG: HU family DNA-binding protein [Rubricoccaceae bacterium]|nr:HU family DNA-binding protein [Rubricoccaceae bacterium]